MWDNKLQYHLFHVKIFKIKPFEHYKHDDLAKLSQCMW